MQKNCLFFLLSLGFTLRGIGQASIETYVKQEQIVLKHIQPEPDDYNDLEPIGELVGDARVVMLGEQDHGDAPAFLAKTRLVKYLHEKKGFNVLAFESDFFSLNRGWDQIEKDSLTLYPFLRKNITSVWTYCDACQYLLKTLIPGSFRTGHPIHITGIDNQQFLNYSYKNLRREFEEKLKSLSLADTTGYAALLSTVDTLSMMPFIPKKKEFYEDAADRLTSFRKELVSKLPANDFWLMVVDNLISYAREMYYLPKDPDKGRNFRDVQMANNLRWLATVKYANEKIIVWAQNFHVSKHNGNYPDKAFNDLLSMGAAFTMDSIMRKSTYIIGFTSAEGSAGRVNSKIFDIVKPGKNSFETWISDSTEYAFVDFSKFNQQNPGNDIRFKMNGSVVKDLHKPYAAEWARIFDAVFFIRKMYPCKVYN